MLWRTRRLIKFIRADKREALVVSFLSGRRWDDYPLHLVMITPLYLAISQNFQITAYRITPSK